MNKIGGAEQVLQSFHELYPQAVWYTSVWDKKRAPYSRDWVVHSSWLNKIPFLRTHHEWIPFLMPFVFESFDLREFDLVITIGSAESKGVITTPSTLHLNYCLTPTRYLYSHKDEYLHSILHRRIGDILRKWDLVASTRPDVMIAISTQVKNRIKKYYNRDVDIIFPPVDTKKFVTSGKLDNWKTGIPNDYFLVVSRLVPYKKIDVLVQAANIAKVNLVIIGDGSAANKLRDLAGPTVTFMGQVSDSELPGYYAHALAYLQANEEDFGISMCESLSSGRPVIAYGSGGALDIVTPGKNGILLKHNTAQVFAKALSEFDTMSFVSADCIESVARFDKSIWKQTIIERIASLWQKTQM